MTAAEVLAAGIIRAVVAVVVGVSGVVMEGNGCVVYLIEKGMRGWSAGVTQQLLGGWG